MIIIVAILCIRPPSPSNTQLAVVLVVAVVPLRSRHPGPHPTKRDKVGLSLFIKKLHSKMAQERPKHGMVLLAGLVVLPHNYFLSAIFYMTRCPGTQFHDPPSRTFTHNSITSAVFSFSDFSNLDIALIWARA